MQQLEITRKKSLFGALIPYFVWIGHQKTKAARFNPNEVADFADDSCYPIKNGRTLRIPIEDQGCSVLVSANTSTGVVFSEAFDIPAGSAGIELELITKYNWRSGSQYVLRRL